jgi:hypothetical protein
MQIWIGDEALEKFYKFDSFEELGALSDGIEALPTKAKEPIVKVSVAQWIRDPVLFDPWIRDSGWNKSRASIRVRDEHPGFEIFFTFLG